MARRQTEWIEDLGDRLGALTARTTIVIVLALALLIFLTTLQIDINGSTDPYVTDVGEIQNALPRWGTIHFTGYPQFTALGSTFVTIFRFLGVEPAAGASLFSTLWGVISVGLLAYLALMFAVPPWASVVASLLFAVSTSFWIDASIAEVHTMTMAITLGTIIAAISFGRSGSKKSLYWLAFLVGQGVAHQRAFIFLGVGLLILILPNWRIIISSLPAVIGLFLIGPLTYIYLPIRAWQGAEWTFNAPGTWNGFWSIVFDNKAARVVEMPTSVNSYWIRVKDVFSLIADDWPWLLTIIGLLGLSAAGSGISRRERSALALIWIPYLLVSFIIWIGRVGEAVLAIKLPVVAMAALGLAFVIKMLMERNQLIGRAAILLGFVLIVVLYLDGRSGVLAITRDTDAHETIATIARVKPAEDGQINTLMALEGHDYWQVAYAQEYDGQLSELNLVNHQRNFKAILERGDHLLMLGKTFYSRPVETWESMLGPIFLKTAAPGVIEVDIEPDLFDDDQLAPVTLDLNNGIAIQKAALMWADHDSLILVVDWIAQDEERQDYSVAVHLVSQDPPVGPQDIISQADRNHPVDGWYPSSLWTKGEIVKDHYLLTIAPGSNPQAVRVGMYQELESGEFINTPWLSVPIPP